MYIYVYMHLCLFLVGDPLVDVKSLGMPVLSEHDSEALEARGGLQRPAGLELPEVPEGLPGQAAAVGLLAGRSKMAGASLGRGNV